MFFRSLLTLLFAGCLLAPAWGSDIWLPMDGVKKRIWYQTYGSFSTLTSDDSRKEVSGNAFGLMVGCDRRLGSYAQFGFGIGGDWTNAEKKDGSYELDIPSVKALLHAQFVGNRWYWDVDAEFGAGQYKEHYRTAADDFRVSEWKNQWGVGTELGIRWEHGMTRTEPFLALRRTILDDEADDNCLTILALGCRYDWKFSGPLAVVRPGIFGGYIHQFEKDLFASESWIPCATVYRIPDTTMDQDRVFLGMGVSMSMRKSLDVYGKFCSDFSGDYSSYTIFAGMNWNF